MKNNCCQYLKTNLIFVQANPIQFNPIQFNSNNQSFEIVNKNLYDSNGLKQLLKLNGISKKQSTQFKRRIQE